MVLIWKTSEHSKTVHPNLLEPWWWLQISCIIIQQSKTQRITIVEIVKLYFIHILYLHMIPTVQLTNDMSHVLGLTVGARVCVSVCVFRLLRHWSKMNRPRSRSWHIKWSRSSQSCLQRAEMFTYSSTYIQYIHVHSYTVHTYVAHCVHIYNHTKTHVQIYADVMDLF